MTLMQRLVIANSLDKNLYCHCDIQIRFIVDSSDIMYAYEWGQNCFHILNILNESLWWDCTLQGQGRSSRSPPLGRRGWNVLKDLQLCDRRTICGGSCKQFVLKACWISSFLFFFFNSHYRGVDFVTWVLDLVFCRRQNSINILKRFTETRICCKHIYQYSINEKDLSHIKTTHCLCQQSQWSDAS